MKFNWGHGILLAIVLGSGGILFLVYLSSREKIDLVTEEYYPKELVYEEQIQKTKNANALPERINLFDTPDTLSLKFPPACEPHDSISGIIHFYFPADKYRDKVVPIKLDSLYVQHILKADLGTGKFELIIDWQCRETGYFQKELLFLSN